MHGIKRKIWTQKLLQQKKLKDQKKIKDYRAKINEILTLKDSKLYTTETLQKTSDVLRINPELNTVWNYRRDIIVNLKTLDTQFWENELEFVMEQMKRFPKVYWIWNHRVWCLKEYPGSPPKIWQRELLFVDKLLEMDARNYHGWHYRRIVIDKLQLLTGENYNKSELDNTTKNINQSISNFSSWHQRAKLIPKLFEANEIDDKNQFVQDEFKYITNAMFTDAEDQSVWIFMKWLIRSKIVSDALSKDEFIKLLEELQNNIILINKDDIEFSGKQNTWCLKLLIVIEDVQQNLGVTIESKKKDYINLLIEADPDRKNRYLHLLNMC